VFFIFFSIFFSVLSASALASGLGDDYIVTTVVERTMSLVPPPPRVIQYAASEFASQGTLPFAFSFCVLGWIPVTFDRDVAVHMELLDPTCCGADSVNSDLVIMPRRPGPPLAGKARYVAVKPCAGLNRSDALSIGFSVTAELYV
jgi:hypothetical protein